MAVTQLAPIAPEKWTPYDEFNVVIPRETFPAEGMTARAAQAIVNSFAWTDSNPMLNLSSFVTTYAEPEAVEVARTHMYKNYIDHDMYPQVSTMERLMVNWLHNLWNGPKGVEPMAQRPLVPRRLACWVDSPTSGIGARRGGKQARAQARRIWLPAATYRSYGRSSCAISMSSRVSCL